MERSITQLAVLPCDTPCDFDIRSRSLNWYDCTKLNAAVEGVIKQSLTDHLLSLKESAKVKVKVS